MTLAFGNVLSGARKRRAAKTVEEKKNRDRHLAGKRMPSLRLRLLILFLAFLAVPFFLYQQFQAADRDRQQLLLDSVHEQGRILAAALRPVLLAGGTQPLTRIGLALRTLTPANARVTVLMRPADARDPRAFFFVAEEPVIDEEERRAFTDALLKQGLLDKLATTCEGGIPLAQRFSVGKARQEVLSSINPIRTEQGCWAILVSHDSSAYLDSALGRPYWQTPEVLSALAIYMLLALVVFSMFAGFWRSLRHFSQVARELRSGGEKEKPFADRAILPELTTLASDFDHMVDNLRQSALLIRQAAQENAHAFKTPLAVLRQSLELLMRREGKPDPLQERAFSAMDTAVNRLEALAADGWRLEGVTADLLDPPRQPVDLSQLLRRMLSAYAMLCHRRGLVLDSRIDDGIVVLAGEEFLETAIENLLENAVSFSPHGGALTVTLRREKDQAVLIVEDEGPGISPETMPRIFDRYYSNRPGQADKEDEHFGIGLWQVRCHVTALGGKVRAENRTEGGLRMVIELPRRR